jgi:hypothetical protein
MNIYISLIPPIIYISVMNNGSDLLTTTGLCLELDEMCITEVGFKDLD